MDNFLITQHCTDLEVAARFYAQAVNLNAFTLLEERRKEFFESLRSTMLKHTAIRSHLQNYKTLEQKTFDEFVKTMDERPNETREAFELIRELEAFFFQVKSSLDMIVKIMNPILGKGFVRTKTYADEGDVLVKGLQQYSKKGGVNLEAVERLIELIRADKKEWLAWAVDCRDQLSHTQALSNFKFTVRGFHQGVKQAVRPRFGGEETVPLLERVFQNNLEFQQDFLAFALAIALPQGLVLALENPERAQSEFGPSGAYIKYCVVFVRPEKP